MLGPIQRRSVKCFKSGAKRAAKFANDVSRVGKLWHSEDRKLESCTLVKAYTGRRAWKAIGNRLLKAYYLSRDDHNRKIRTRRKRTDCGKYSFINRNIKSPESITCKLTSVFPL